jgi:type VI secretion system secreted protein VgrG
MSTLELTFASGESSLSVRRFAIEEAVSSLFSVSVWARSPDPSVDLDALVGRPATFRVVAGYKFALGQGARAWSGVVSYAEQVYALQPTPGQKGLSTYQLTIVPELWLLTQRSGNRVYQHLSIPDIADRLLAEWSIKPVWAIDRARYPKLEYKVQYGESDYAFLSRLLEEAGIAFTFDHAGGEGSVLTLADRLEANKPRPGDAIPYVDSPNQASEMEFVTRVEVGREVRPGAVAIRDYDFRNPAFSLFGEVSNEDPAEARFEQYFYDAGAFLIEAGKGGNTPVADDKGVARYDQKYGRELAERELYGDRVRVRGVSFDANAYDLAPGVVFSIDDHPHPELPASRRLLVLDVSFEGTVEGEWGLSGNAVFADAPYRPPRRTPKPVIEGFQSAVVVGPAGQEIHTDEFGRVRVQFHWDREGKRDDYSSCWIRVNQGWGGMGYGMITLPRVGHEVLVGFLEGDPDQPAVMGRVYNAVQQVPYKLPDHKTRSTWKSDSSLGHAGFNEIMFEDLKGKELVFQHAERDRTRLVKNDEQSTVGHDRQKLVKNDESERTEGLRRRWVGKDADSITKEHVRERIEGNTHLEVRGSVHEQVDGKQSLTVVEDRQEKVEGRLARRAGREVHHVAGEAWVSEASADVTVRGPGGFIRIDAGGVTIVGTLVKINIDGDPGKGKGSRPEPPEEPPETPAPSEPPPPEPAPQEVTTWIEIVLLTEAEPRRPMANQRYRIELPDGSIRQGRLDANGKARLEGIDPGTCKVSFPDLDASSWHKA